MKTNIEIEFKSAITKEVYDRLLKSFDLENNVFKQTNYYFDSDGLDLNHQKIVLRIRKKGTFYKLTLKSQHEMGAFESHVIIDEATANNMIDNGFNVKEYFDNHDLFVTFKASLDNYRVSTPYKNGKLFLDECQYNGITDYEIEYEVSNFHEGLETFNKFLEKQSIAFAKSKRKSEKALATSK